MAAVQGAALGKEMCRLAVLILPRPVPEVWERRTGEHGHSTWCLSSSLRASCAFIPFLPALFLLLPSWDCRALQFACTTPSPPPALVQSLIGCKVQVDFPGRAPVARSTSTTRGLFPGIISIFALSALHLSTVLLLSSYYFLLTIITQKSSIS